MHDRADRFKARGIVEFVMRDGTGLTVKADGDLHIQIILCGLKLVHQLVAGEHYKHTLFNTDHYCTDKICFEYLQRQIIKQIPAVEKAFEAIEKELCRHTGCRVEQLLKNVFFKLLKKAAEIAN
jgi:hypothetical protein